MSAKPTVWKFNFDPFEHGGHFTIECQAGAVPVFFGIDKLAQEQRRRWAVWVQLRPAVTERKHYHFCIVGTGMDIPPEHTHFMTIQDGQYVWHLYQADGNE